VGGILGGIGSFAIAEGIDQVVGAFLGGLVLAAIVKRSRA